MSSSKFFRGAPLLIGDNTTPGVRIPDELMKLIPTIFQKVRDFGCDFYPTVVQMLTYDEISEIAAYDGFPVRFPHWKWGMEYEELQRGYEHGMHRIYEMVINNNPCYIYCLDSNTLVDHVTVIAHALGHNDFFKNNVFFSRTNMSMMDEFANHGTKIRRYMTRWGKERVIEFLDHVLRIETLVDPAKAWQAKIIKDPVIRDKRIYREPNRLSVKDDHDYMEDYINPKGWCDEQRKKIERKEVAEQLSLFTEPTKDILGFIRDNAPLKPWQADIVAMMYEEAMYFCPQRQTKVLNEGWASYIDFNIMARQGYVSLGQKSHDCGIVEYSKHKMGVLGGKYSMNSYKLGFTLFMDVEERWNKGRFGDAYDSCTDMIQKENWDTTSNLGHKKVFEVRQYYDDLTAIIEFFTEDFCTKNEFFEWKHRPNGDWVIESRDYKKIKQKLVERHMNGGLPQVRLADPNHKGNRSLFLEHVDDGRPLLDKYVRPVLQSLYHLWGNDVYLSTKKRGGKEIMYWAMGTKDEDVGILTREEYEKDESE